MKDLEKLIDEVNGSMSMEGMPLTKTDKDIECGAVQAMMNWLKKQLLSS